MTYRYKKQEWTEDEVSNMVWDSVVQSTECTECGHSWSVEPDAEDYKCQDCGEGKCHSPLVALGLM